MQPLQKFIFLFYPQKRKWRITVDKKILNLKPRNLPTYIYHLLAEIGLVHNRFVYKLQGYQFRSISVATNQPLRVGDVVDNSCCYFGNQSTEIIPDLIRKRVLSGVEEELQYYHGCQIDRLCFSYADNQISSCGNGYCIVFIELSSGKIGDEMRRLQELESENKLNRTEVELLLSLEEEYSTQTHNLEYWKQRIPDWDKRVEFIGEIPNDLIY
ncbi:hypothetical protein [Mastigocoleus testarum]|uniref:Uncharacterized protein n=1 Tax=Mastigocoleus testarum BC008 TaxID=371196 RepID=A0A0V7ZRX2_9CYAN|nr:hypothetical protein [Mastigocoleus testarum]KST67397.1 hypothetical protein BC008_29835 [Mastigocoleus testarum BC008]